MRISSAFFNIISRMSHGLFHWWDRRALSAAEQTNVAALTTPITPVSHRDSFALPSGGQTNVAIGAASYWASLPRLELPATNLTPHYLRDFIANPPMEAA